MTKWKKWGAAAALAVAAAGTTVALPYFVGEKVTQVLDGDSFKIANKQTIRLASLNAPETGNCMGSAAAAALSRKILGKRVVLRDVKTDIYRRIMALVYVRGELVNAYMIKNGFAVSTREAGQENPDVSAANLYAREHHLGVFGPDCFQPDPPDPNCPIKGNIDDRTGEKQYLLPSCRHYSKVIIEKSYGESYFCTEKEARTAGFVRSCDPRLSD